MSAHLLFTLKSPPGQNITQTNIYHLQKYDGDCENSFWISPRIIEFSEIVEFLIIEINNKFIH